jgi:hypothetical protein
MILGNSQVFPRVCVCMDRRVLEPLTAKKEEEGEEEANIESQTAKPPFRPSLAALERSRLDSASATSIEVKSSTASSGGGGEGPVGAVAAVADVMPPLRGRVTLGPPRRSEDDDEEEGSCCGGCGGEARWPAVVDMSRPTVSQISSQTSPRAARRRKIVLRARMSVTTSVGKPRSAADGSVGGVSGEEEVVVGMDLVVRSRWDGRDWEASAGAGADEGIPSLRFRFPVEGSVARDRGSDVCSLAVRLGDWTDL